MNTSKAKLRPWAVVALLSTSIACLLFAADNITTSQQNAADVCKQQALDCSNRCDQIKDYTVSVSCGHACDAVYYKCMNDAGIPGYSKPPQVGKPGATAPPNKSNPTPTPRKGPGNISGLPASNPTPTPRKGPGKVGTSGIGKASPTPSPKGPVLLEKSGKGSPTPKPTPRKKDDHQDHH